MSTAVAPARETPARVPAVTIAQRWTCPGCMTTGRVLCSSRDDAAKVFTLAHQAHQLKTPGCLSMIRFGRRGPVDHPNEHVSGAALARLDDPAQPD